MICDILHLGIIPAESEMKKLLVGSIVIAGIAYETYNYWKQTPEYSLLQIKLALETKDSYLFEKHVDLDRLISRGVDAVIESSINKNEKGTSKIFAKPFWTCE